MKNFKSCIPYVCTGSGCKQVCRRHDIGTQCGATATNIAAQTTKNFDATSNQQNSQKLLTAVGNFQSSKSESEQPRWLPTSRLCA